MTQNQYGILVALPDAGPTGYRVSVAFAGKRYSTVYLPGSLPADSRNGLRIFAPSPAYPNGRSRSTGCIRRQ